MPLAGYLALAGLALLFSVIAVVVHIRENRAAKFQGLQGQERISFHPSRKHSCR